MRERKRSEEGRFRALESFLQANTDLSTQRHSWKRNLIREKLNSFKCTSRPLFTPYLPPPLFPPTPTSLSFASLLPLPPFEVCNPAEQPTWFFLLLLLRLSLSSPLSTLAPFSYLLILSQPFSLRKRRSAIHPFSSPSLFHLYSLFSLTLSLFVVLSSLFYAPLEDAPIPCQRSLLFLSSY